MNADIYPVEQIDVGQRLRATNPDRVAEIALSIDERGLLQPIGLSAEVGGRRKLVFGAHRLAAFLASNGRNSAIRFVERAGSPDELRLMEIDENLYRHELTAADEAAFLTERGDVFQRISRLRNPSRKQNSAKLAQADFFAELDGLFGLKKRAVQLALARRKNIADEAWAMLLTTPLADNGAGLDELGRCDRDKQVDALHVLYVSKAAKTIQAAIALVMEHEAREPASLFDRLVKRWPKLSEPERRKIKSWVAKQAYD